MKKTVLMSTAKKARIALAVMAVFGMSFVGARSVFAEIEITGTNNTITDAKDSSMVIGTENVLTGGVVDGEKTEFTVLGGKNKYEFVSFDSNENLKNNITILGNGNDIKGVYATVIGNDNKGNLKDDLVLGNGNTLPYSLPLGTNVVVGNNMNISTGWNVVVGYNTTISGGTYNSVVIGNGNDLIGDGAHAVVVGNGITSESYGGVAIGLWSKLGRCASITLGAHSTATGEYSDAFGRLSKATGKYSVALGDDSTADEDNTVSVGGMHEVQIGNKPTGEAIMETQWLKRRITNVADGTKDTDAATVGQVKSMIAAGGAGSITTEKFNEMLNNNDAFNSLKNNMNGKADVDGGNIDKSQWADKLGTGAIANGDKNLVNGETVYNKIGDTSQLANANLGNNLSDAVITVNTKAEDNKKKIGDTTKLTNAGLGDNLSDAVVKVNDKVGDTSKLTTANLGNNLSDAVVKVDDKTKQNAKDIEKVNGRVDELGDRVDTLGGAVAKLDSRVNKVGAGAAALAALHPMEFDSDNKLSFAAGVGNYRGTNAAAIGAFYRPSEQVMFSISGNMGNGENMVNAGVSFALDRPSKTPTTKVALVKTVVAQNEQIAALNETVAEQNEKIARLEAMVEKLAAQGK